MWQSNHRRASIEGRHIVQSNTLVMFQLFAIIAYQLATSLLSITAFKHRTEIQAYLLI
jgi:hypothetical protein